jgi:hypothetical protein
MPARNGRVVDFFFAGLFRLSGFYLLWSWVRSAICGEEVKRRQAALLGTKGKKPVLLKSNVTAVNQLREKNR